MSLPSWAYVYGLIYLGIVIKFLRRLQNAVTQSATGFIAVMRQPAYIVLAFIIGFILSTIIYFSINYNFYGSLLLSPMAITAKISLLGTMVGTMVVSYFNEFTGFLLLILALLQGSALSMLIYNVKRNRKFDTKTMAGSGFAAVAAVIGLGCVPCGTSLLIPVMTIIFASSAPALLDTANLVVLVLASLLSIYAVYAVGRVSYTNHMIESVEGGND